MNDIVVSSLFMANNKRESKKTKVILARGKFPCSTKQDVVFKFPISKGSKIKAKKGQNIGIAEPSKYLPRGKTRNLFLTLLVTLQ